MRWFYLWFSARAASTISSRTGSGGESVDLRSGVGRSTAAGDGSGAGGETSTAERHGRASAGGEGMWSELDIPGSALGDVTTKIVGTRRGARATRVSVGGIRGKGWTAYEA